ncbi:hypothetical protein Mgra_00003133, partial [Meloidogyne graminicola]
PKEKQLNKFLYHLQKPEGIKEQINLNNSLIRSLSHSTNNGLLLPNPSQLPSIFRLSATAMSQSQAFSLNSTNFNKNLIEQLTTTQKSFELIINNNNNKEIIKENNNNLITTTTL